MAADSPVAVTEKVPVLSVLNDGFTASTPANWIVVTGDDAVEAEKESLAGKP